VNYSDSKARLQLLKNEVHFKSRFKHLQAHNGFRPGELHTFIAEKGGGKSTLVRAWVIDMLLQDKRVYIRLSEERSQPYFDAIVEYLGPDYAHKSSTLIVDSEIEIGQDELGDNYIDSLQARTIASNAQILIIDNFTTSALARVAPNTQERFAVNLRQMAMDSDIPVIVVAHTEKGYSNKKGIATGDNIRGNMTLSNTAAYIYTLTVFHQLAGRPAILFIDKARFHPSANKKLFMLSYEQETYVSDRPMTFDDVKVVLRDAQK
jgi:hypothetical protein